MDIAPEPLAEITRRAIEVLYRELGPADAVPFLDQYTTGHGDYTAERDVLFAGVTLDQILAEVRPSRDPR